MFAEQASGLLIPSADRFELLESSIWRLASISRENATAFINEQMKQAELSDDTELLRFLGEQRLSLMFDGRISIRIPVPKGALNVVWRTDTGKKRASPAINVSMYGVLFHSPDFNGVKIDTVESPDQTQLFRVKKGRIEHRGDGYVAALLDRFSDNIGDRMDWSELITKFNDHAETVATA